ncbi:MAG: hypothetical protein V1799_17335 [bacterium]
MIRRMVVVGLLLIIAISVQAQFKQNKILDEHQKIHFTGNLSVDLAQLNEISINEGHGFDSLLEEEKVKKSPLLAALYSAAIPGAGEFYTERYWKAGGFLAAEIALWVVYAVYDGKGNDQTAIFEQFADDHWSVVHYANWMEVYANELRPGVQFGPIVIKTTGKPWENINWNELNRAEELLGQQVGNGFTHRLPMRPDQQYYEEIGKYPQYGGGWEDAQSYQPGGYKPFDVTKSNVPPMFFQYSKMRGRANDLYTVGRTASSLLVANHVLSALDAAWSATQFNAELKVEAHLQPVQRPYGIVEFVPTAKATLRF